MLEHEKRVRYVAKKGVEISAMIIRSFLKSKGNQGSVIK